MQWVLKILRKHLDNETKWLSYEGIAATDIKIAAGVRLARERIPQLEQAIAVLKTQEISSKTNAPALKKKQPPQNQFSLFDILKSK